MATPSVNQINVLEHVSQGVAMYDGEKKLAIWNSQYERILMFPQGFLETALPMRELVLFLARRGDYGPGDPDELCRERIEIICDDSKAPKSITVLGEKTYEVLTMPTEGGGVVITYTDVTARDQTVNELRRVREELEHRVEERTHDLRQAKDKAEAQEGLFTKVYQSSPALFTIASPKDGSHIDVNQAWVSLTGYSREDAFKKSAVELGIWADPESRVKFVEQIKENGFVRNFETVYRIKGGELKDMLLSGEIIEFRGDECILVVGQDISERAKIDKMKSEFIATVSHELRTPLTSISGSLGLAISGVLGELPEKAKEMIDIAHKNCGRLINLVNEILDVEKLNSSAMAYDHQILDLGELLLETIKINEGLAAEQDIRFVSGEIVPNTMVHGDAFRLTQVVSNLLSNAAKFSPKGEVVMISTCIENGHVKVLVSDKGAGIPHSFRAQIFSQFAQADASDSRKKGGTGLGLNISRSIVESHNGKIGFQSDVGVGSTFYFTLPLKE